MTMNDTSLLRRDDDDTSLLRRDGQRNLKPEIRNLKQILT